MPEEKSDIDERFKLIRITSRRYRAASREEKSQILDQLETQTGLCRKTLIRRLNGGCIRKKRKRQRGRKYGPGVDDALRVLSEASNFICAERLQPNLGWMTQHLVNLSELTLKPGVEELLEQISVATVRRILHRIHQDRPPRRRASGFSNDVRDQIPMRRIDWKTRTPGHFEVDLVFHCSPISSGEFVYSLVMVDVATGWCECAAMLGKSYRGMRDAFQRCLTRCPVPAQEVHSDNGSEFFSGHLLTFWGERAHVPELSRSRPYRKNDNRYVEHGNGALVRSWLRHDRLETTQQTIALNQSYTRLWLYFNFFQPVQHLAQKRWVGHRAVRVHDTAQTPFDRMVQAGVLSSDQTAQLTKLRDSCDFRQLRNELCDTVGELFAMPLAMDGVTEDIFATLLPSRR